MPRRRPPARERQRANAATRDHILDAAAALLRSQGLEGPSVAAVMAEADRTHGSFYAHFASRSQLVAAAIGRAAGTARAAYFESMGRRRGASWLRAAVRGYLNRTHRDDLAGGCPFATLGQEVGRAGAPERGAFEAELRRSAAMFAEQWTLAGARVPDERALATLALCAGGIMLARAVEDPALSDRILRASRAMALEAVDREATTLEESKP
jgi:TetR/AcrR family transcriptional repressor of nem operon